MSVTTRGVPRKRGRYKTRKDKLFCSDTHRASQHYRDKKKRNR